MKNIKTWFSKKHLKKHIIPVMKGFKTFGKEAIKILHDKKITPKFIKEKGQQGIHTLKKYFETQWKIATGKQEAPAGISFAEVSVKFIQKHTAEGPLLVLKLICGFLALFILWASFFKISETVKATGEVIPSKFLQKLGSVEGGVIKKIHVREGEAVKAGQPLISLDPTQNESKREEYERDYYRSMVNIERLKAQIHRGDLKISEESIKKFPDFAKEAMEAFNNEKSRLEKEKTSLSEEIKSKTHTLQQSKERLKHSEKQLPIMEEQYKITDTLFKKGLYSKLKNLDAERQKIDVEKEIASLKEQIPSLEADIKQAEAKLSKIETDFIAQYEKELRDEQTKFDQAESNKEVAEDKIKHNEIRSPIDGIVKDIGAKTVGGVVRPGEEVLTVVPTDDELLIEAKVQPGDIGFIHPGQPVSIKITTFDYTIFGRLMGNVEKISPDANQDKQDKSYFKVTVKADHNYLERDGKRMYLGFGMAADLDIEIGKHSVMTFILKPILRGFHGALTER